jgi:hypothetical protein
MDNGLRRTKPSSEYEMRKPKEDPIAETIVATGSLTMFLMLRARSRTVSRAPGLHARTAVVAASGISVVMCCVV